MKFERELPVTKQAAEMLRKLAELTPDATRWTKDVALELADQIEALVSIEDKYDNLVAQLTAYAVGMECSADRGAIETPDLIRERVTHLRNLVNKGYPW